MLIFTPLLLFLLLPFELALAAKKSTQEARFAFLFSRMQSSGQQALSEMLERLSETKDAKRLHSVLREAGILAGNEMELKDLENLESSLMKEIEHRYETILNYMTDDLKGFFEAYKILWDLENMKKLLQNLLSSDYTEPVPIPSGPFGHIGRVSVEELTAYRTPEKLLEKAKELLPVDMASILMFKKDVCLRDFCFGLDLAAFEYLRKKSEEIGTQNTRLAWSFLEGLYEIKNLRTIARLKHNQGTSEQIVPFLFPSRSKLDDAEINRLLETEDYYSFLYALRKTPYGDYVENGRVDPVDFENALQKNIRKLAFVKADDINATMIVQIPLMIETQSEAIRKMAFQTLIIGYEKR